MCSVLVNERKHLCYVLQPIAELKHKYWTRNCNYKKLADKSSSSNLSRWGSGACLVVCDEAAKGVHTNGPMRVNVQVVQSSTWHFLIKMH